MAANPAIKFVTMRGKEPEEAKFFCPGIMTALAKDALDGLLDHPHLAGSPDPELKRLYLGG